jgi:hypothetical protein
VLSVSDKNDAMPQVVEGYSKLTGRDRRGAIFHWLWEATLAFVFSIAPLDQRIDATDDHRHADNRIEDGGPIDRAKDAFELELNDAQNPRENEKTQADVEPCRKCASEGAEQPAS